jgi:hypothetical protein
MLKRGSSFAHSLGTCLTRGPEAMVEIPGESFEEGRRGSWDTLIEPKGWRERREFSKQVQGQYSLWRSAGSNCRVELTIQHSLYPLTWNIIRNRARSIIINLRGLTQANPHILYCSCTCVIPIVAHASPAWYSEDGRKKSRVNAVRMVQNKMPSPVVGLSALLAP